MMIGSPKPAATTCVESSEAEQRNQQHDQQRRRRERQRLGHPQRHRERHDGKARLALLRQRDDVARRARAAPASAAGECRRSRATAAISSSVRSATRRSGAGDGAGSQAPPAATSAAHRARFRRLGRQQHVLALRSPSWQASSHSSSPYGSLSRRPADDPRYDRPRASVDRRDPRWWHDSAEHPRPTIVHRSVTRTWSLAKLPTMSKRPLRVLVPDVDDEGVAFPAAPRAAHPQLDASSRCGRSSR